MAPPGARWYNLMKVLHTLWKETAVPIDQMLPEEPAVAEFIVPFGQLDPISSLRKTQFVRNFELESHLRNKPG